MKTKKQKPAKVIAKEQLHNPTEWKINPRKIRLDRTMNEILSNRELSSKIIYQPL